MPFVCHDLDQLHGSALVGSGCSTDLVQAYINVLRLKPISEWKKGQQVVQAVNIRKGTAIAAFQTASCPSTPLLLHAAFLVQISDKGIWILDQWANDPVNRPTVKLHFIPLVAKRRGSEFYGFSKNLCSNAFDFYVIEI